MLLFLFLVAVAILLGVFGSIVEGLFYLLVIGIFVALIAFLYAAWRITAGANRRSPR
ncbi:hypothetical protein [Streptomyces qinglanensis]|uniref:Uncharacterized protein n=1 Tax=Streptomyces qinglanensis TaxID=943816 RepID=A0A1H9T1T7_9ACTN|nr:hypothetical protein [Streptomyces qinglanensis]SER91232.1 hypothetical protein SAMN05421870_105273 [Streptomyces qinglanensis]